MTTITPSRIRNERPSLASRAGFTLVEVMVGAALGSIILAAVLSTFLFLLRSGENLGNYNDMQTQARYATEVFAEDVRQASAITWTSSTAMTLTVNSTSVTYAYDSANGNFNRTVGTTTTNLITGIVSGSFSFTAYSIAAPTTALSFSDLTNASKNTKQVQISLRASRTTTTVVSATNLILSARYILRNKIVTA